MFQAFMMIFYLREHEICFEFPTIWQNEHLADSKRLSEMRGHQDPGTMIHRSNQLGAPDPEITSMHV